MSGVKERYLKPIILNDALQDKKMAFISGPRQVGKTNLAMQFLGSSKNYFNWDEPDFKRLWVKNPVGITQNLDKGPVVLDELHKYKLWKSTLKGFYDRVGKDLNILVTGSARLDLYKKGGDSLMGRYIPYRLYPFTVSERTHHFPDPDHLTVHPIEYPLEALLHCSGFPDPLIGGSKDKAQRWSRIRTDQVVREDVRDFKNIQDLESMKLLVDLLPERVGSPLSINSLKQDLQVAYATIRDWITILKNLYLTFQVPPYSKNISRSLTKESKYYLYDWLPIKAPGPLLENVVAVHLLKACHFWTDTGKGVFELQYIRTREKLEVDFCIVRDKKIWMLIECKSNDASLSPALKKMAEQFPQVPAFQLTLKNENRKIPGTKLCIMNTEKFLSQLI